MNIIDCVILFLLCLFILNGYYRGFMTTVLSIGSYILSWLVGLVLRGPVARAIAGHTGFFNSLLYYTEGAEYIKNVELAKTPISQISAADLNEVMRTAELPYPMGNAISENVAKESFAAQEITTLGDYFNQTMVLVFINILAFLIVFAAVRLILEVVINGVDYAYRLPKLRQHDKLIACGCGLVRGILAVFLVFTLVPIVLTVLPFDGINEMLESSFFAPFFYHSNFFLAIMPGT